MDLLQHLLRNLRSINSEISFLAKQKDNKLQHKIFRISNAKKIFQYNDRLFVFFLSMF